MLKGYDQTVNLVLEDSFERVYSLKEPVEAVELGLYIIRGDNMYVFKTVTPSTSTNSPSQDVLLVKSLRISASKS